MISALISRLIILSFGTLYPAYASYKAVRTKNVKEYVKWMMYWIVYAFFTCIETFTDIFLSWFPFYYEVKVIIVLWLLSPATKGSSTLYRKFVHPMLTRREQEIDEYLNQAKERGYSAVLQLGTKGVNYATNVIMQTALKGGGNLVQTIRRSYSLSDLSEPDVHRTQDEIDDVVQMRSHQRMLRPRPQAGGIARSASGTRHSTGMYFSEVDVVKGADGYNYNIRSSEDISSGYSSAEPLSAGLSRTSSMTNASKARLKGARRTEPLNERQQFRTQEQNFNAVNQFHMPGFRQFEYENEFDDCEAFEETPIAIDIPKCIQTLEETPLEALEDNNTKEATETQPEMETIAENGDVGATFETASTERSVNEEPSKGSADSETMQKAQKEIELMPVEEYLALFNAKVDFISDADTFNSGRISDEDNESDEFSDALPSLADDDAGELDDVVTKATDMEKSKYINECAEASEMLNMPQSSIELRESSQTITQNAATAAEIQKTDNKKESAKELQDTLQDIKNKFRGNIVHNPTSSSLCTCAVHDTASNARPLKHNKGKAPPPPRPARPAHLAPTSLATNVASSPSSTLSNSALDAVDSSSRSPSPAPSSKGMFKHFKTNLFHFGSNSSVSDKQLDGNVDKSHTATPPFETQL
ncbi:uncharacterized protein ReepA isoform X3 [Eurosta solidaginis]|uniref:uncharacterized protein ReepA isoform X3 n=1 Tax=Eurosta solidaginis TaxID=178769 RepID=UPI003531662A